jgi:hypothetical protein
MARSAGRREGGGDEQMFGANPKKSPAIKRGRENRENGAAITEFWLVLFSAEQANRCRHQLGGREDLHLREDLEHLELLVLVLVLVMVMVLLLLSSEPTLERPVPATGLSSE